MKALIIGCGAMGSWMARMWKENFGEVTICDIDEKKSYRLAKKLEVKRVLTREMEPDADVVLVAVPISETSKVIETVAPKLKQRCLLADLCSVKHGVVESMKKISTQGELASLHPLFGPGATTLSGKDIVSIPVRTRRTYRKLMKAFESLGAKITEMSADEHDKLMALIQCMTHFTLMAYLSAYESLKEFDRRPIRTPLFDSLLKTAEAMLASDPVLYGEIQRYNQFSRIVRARMIEACKSLDTILSAGNIKSVQELFTKLSEFVKPEEIKHAYKRLYERFEVGS